MTTDEQYMLRCLQLAALGAVAVAPNPMVGAVLVHEGRIIGEGYHRQYGGPHAEVNCLASVQEADRPLIPNSTMYVSLEPCAHFGKTPPCADRLIHEKVKRVVVGCRDPFPEVDGRGLEKLRAAGVEVTAPVCEAEAIALNRRFFTYHIKKRPYIILKWAQSADGFLGRQGERTAISHPITNRLVHRWRNEEAAIMVGKNTALIDDPRLNVRGWPGRQPLRIVTDSHLALPPTLHLFDGSQPTLVFNHLSSNQEGAVEWVRLEEGMPLLPQMMQALYQRGIQSVLVEGGAMLLHSFIEAGLWDEARVIINTHLFLSGGVPAPVFPPAPITERYPNGADLVSIFSNRASTLTSKETP